MRALDLTRIAPRGFSPTLVRSTLAACLVLAACGGGLSPSDLSEMESGAATATSADRSNVELDCERDGYPCSRDEVAAEVLELESRYVAQLRPLYTTGTLRDAAEWIRAQAGVAMADANETTLVFRLEGGRPFFVIRPDRARDPTRAVAPPTSQAMLAGVVGQGTTRDNPRGNKRALFIEPWQSHGLRFADEAALLGGMSDYQHANGVDVLPDDEAGPDDFTFSMWSQYDAIFLKSHGGSLNGQTWVSTGARRELGDRDVNQLCDELYSPRPLGVDCSIVVESELDANDNYVQNPDGSWKLIEWLAVGMQVDHFLSDFGSKGGLKKAIVYFGACDTFTAAVRGPELAAAIAGDSSVFLGWKGQPLDTTEGPTARDLLQELIVNLLPTEAAHDATCADGGCRDPIRGASLELHGSPEASKLRLYDVPVAMMHPSRGATPINIEEGARVPVHGTPGDGRNDEVELMIDLIGIIDPDDGDGELVGDSGILLASYERPALGPTAQATDAANLYNLTVEVNAAQILRDNLGTPQQTGASVTQLEGSGHRYAFTAELPFDVDPAGTPATLKVEVELPEGGISDYEVDVVLVEPEMGATVTIGDETWEFQLDAFVGGCITDTDAQITASAHVGNDLEAASLWADLRPGSWHLEVNDPASDRNWMAAAKRSHMTTLHLVPDGHSQVDELIIEHGRAWGTATFIETNAFIEAEFYNTAYPLPVTGRFEIRCR